MKVVDRFKRRILDLAIRGKLVPQDPNDEPASELLARIRAEKAKDEWGGKGRKGKRSAVGSDGAAYEKRRRCASRVRLQVRRSDLAAQVCREWRGRESSCRDASKSLPTHPATRTGHLRPRQARPSRSALSASPREIKPHPPTSHRPPYGMTSPISE